MLDCPEIHDKRNESSLQHTQGIQFRPRASMLVSA